MSGSILADKCWFHLCPLSPCFSSVLPWHLTDKCVVQCVCRRGGLRQWHVAFSTQKLFSSAHGGSLSHKCFCFIFWLRILCPQTSACDGTLETRVYSQQKKNGVLRKCEVSGMSLIQRLGSKGSTVLQEFVATVKLMPSFNEVYIFSWNFFFIVDLYH